MEEMVYNPYAGVYLRAKELYDEADYQQAFIKLYSVVENDPNNFKANFLIAECYYNGWGTEINYQKAFQNYSLAAINHIPKAAYKVGYCYEIGLGVEKEETQAVSWYMEAMKIDDEQAEYRLGLCYKNGIGIEQNYPHAASCFLKAAQKGNVDAQREAALCYEYLNQPKASATLYLAAANQDDSFACEKIGSFYADGYGCPKSSELPIFYYSKACELGNIHAMLSLAKRYKEGNGVEQSIKDSIYWWLKAAPQSNEAQMEMAECYLTGTGVRQDYVQGMNWLKKAASNNPAAMLKMAELSLNPLPGAERSESEAKIWWSRAAALGDSLAMYKLGVCYEDAIGAVTPNYSEAYKWYRLASQNGNDDATEACKRFTKSMFGTVKLKKEK